MTSFRGDAIKKSLSDDVSITPPTAEDETASKVDHYGVLGRLIDDGALHFLANNEAIAAFGQADSLHELTNMMKTALASSVFQSAREPKHVEAFTNLSTSQRQRNVIDDERHGRIEGNINAGIETFTSLFSSLATILEENYGKEVATHPNNWRIPDRLAKLHIELFGPYVTTYFHTRENIPAFLEQLEPASGGGLQFSTHFPKQAEVSVWTTRHNYRPLLHADDIILNDQQDTIQLQDIEISSPEIGCPVTFDAKTVKELWRIFSEAAAHIETWQDKQTAFARWVLERAIARDAELTDEELQAKFSLDDSEAS